MLSTLTSVPKFFALGGASIVAAGSLAFVVLHAQSARTPPVLNAVPAAPNIVLLIADDLSLQVMDYAASVTLADGSYLMPNFRRYIRDKAVDFRQAFSPNPVCCPARATILTGQYSHNHGTYTNWIRNGTAVSFLDGSDQTGDGVPDRTPSASRSERWAIARLMSGNTSTDTADA